MKLSKGLEELIVNGWICFLIFTIIAVVMYFTSDDLEDGLIIITSSIIVTIVWFIGIYLYVSQLKESDIK